MNSSSVIGEAGRPEEVFMKVTYLGTTVLLFDDGVDQVLFDCHVTRPSLLKCLAGKLSTDKKVANRVMKQCRMNRLRGIIVSHSHHDHVMDAPYFARKCHADVYGSESTANVARGGGVLEERIHVFDPKESIVIGDFRIKVIPSIHSKAHWYNDDLGQVIEEPVVQPAPKNAYKEGGSFDFLVEHSGKRYLIRPSYNYLENQLDGIQADVVFLGVAGMSKDKAAHKEKFFEETLEKVKPELVIPVHWDHFFCPLYGEIKGQPKMMENTGKSLHELARYCFEHDIRCVIQPPLSIMDI